MKSRKTLATKISEAYNLTNAWISATSDGRQQGSHTSYTKYAEDASADDVYLEDISTFSNFILLLQVCLLHLILPSFISVRE